MSEIEKPSSLSSILGKLIPFKPKLQGVFLIAPSYDTVTKRTAVWAGSWDLKNVQLYLGNTATHTQICSLIGGNTRADKVLMFVGHGMATGLLTQPGLGKGSSPISSSKHECLIDTDDMLPALRSIHIVAWACKAGFYFGRKVSELKNSAFLGFNDYIKIVINDAASEQLWSSAMYSLFTRVAEKGAIESHDGEWLHLMLLDLRKQLRRGAVNTGKYNRINSALLKAAAKRACVHV